MRITLLLIALLCYPVEAKPKHKKMALKNSLVAHWGFKDDPALYPVWDNAWPHNNTMQAVGFDPALTPPGSLVTGRVGKAIEVDGGQFFRIADGNAGVSHQGNPFTVAFLFQPSALNQGAVIAANNEWSISTPLNSGIFSFEIIIDGKTLPVTGAPLVVGQYYFLAFGYREDANEVWASVNLGERVTSAHTLGGPSISAFLISGGGAPGIHDDWAIWRREVSAAELSQIYNDGDGLEFAEWDKAAKVCETIPCCD